MLLAIHSAPNPVPQAVPSALALLLPIHICLQQPLLPLCSLEISSLNKTIRITARSTKRIREALQPVLGKYGVSVEQALLRRVRLGPRQAQPSPCALGGALGLGLRL